MRPPTSAGFSTISDLLWYFLHPHTVQFRDLIYLDFFPSYYLETVAFGDPLQVTIGPVEIERGLLLKVIQRRVRQHVTILR
jgi:hypothetical protein